MIKSRKPQRTSPARPRRRVRGTALGREIIDSLTELAEVLESGQSDTEHFTARTVEMPDEPRPYNPTTVRATRDRIGVSQSVFARLLGVSTVLVQAWERGAREPASWARRLLDEMNRDPRHWRGMLLAKAS